MTRERITIGSHEFGPGETFSCQATQIQPDGVRTDTHGGVIEAIRGGGFYGGVVLLPDIVVKTAEPDPWHLLWRRINWGMRPFPPQGLESAAELDHLAATVIHRLFSNLTGGSIVSPASYGYTRLDNGYAQVLERMRGRGARFDILNENANIAHSRRKIWDLGVALGIEHAAQVHPDNPFGKQNLWICDDGQIIWLDVLPAIQHTTRVWPFFRFRFHDDVREKIGDGSITFNTIHTDRVREYMKAHPELFSDSFGDELVFYLDRYDEEATRFTHDMDQDRRHLVVNDALNRGIIDQHKADRLHRSRYLYSQFLMAQILQPAAGTFLEFVKNRAAYRFFSDPSFRHNIGANVCNPDLRRQRILELGALRGLHEAYSLGLVSEEEWQEALTLCASTDKKLMATYLSLQAWYLVSGSIMNAFSMASFASIAVAENKGARLALSLFIEYILPSIVRAASTSAIGLLTKQDLRVAIKVSAIPKMGGYTAVPADMAYRFGHLSELIWHYSKRGIIASLSGILRPWGGWNSDLEEALWGKLNMGDR